MKKTIKSILAIVMILCMLFTAAGCTGGGETNSDEQQVAAGDDFFTDTKTENEATTTDTSSGDKSTTSSKDTQSSSKDNSDKSTGNGSVTTSVLPTENKIGGKSWNEVLKNMPKKLRGTKLVMYNWNPASEYTGAPAVIDSFTKQTGIKVEWQTVNYSSYFTKIAALVGSGENIPDMVRLRAGNVSMLTALQPLSVAKYDFSDEAWDQNLMDLYTYGDNVYGTSLQNTHIGCVNLLFFNQALIEKFDLENPYKLWKADKWTWSKYLEMCREFVDVAGDGYVASNGEGHFTLYNTLWGYSGAIGYNGKKFYNVIGDKDFLKVQQTLGDLYNKEKLFNFGGATTFNDGRALFSIGSAVHLRRKNSYFGSLKSSNDLMAVPLPQIDGQKKYYQGLGEAEAYGIANGASNPEAVPYFLRYFLDGSNYELADYFCNEQNLEVYNWCMSQKNKVFSYGFGDIGGIEEGGMEGNTGAQMKSYLDANKGVVDKNVKTLNEDTLPKLIAK